jgi:hypothetical protein
VFEVGTETASVCVVCRVSCRVVLARLTDRSPPLHAPSTKTVSDRKNYSVDNCPKYAIPPPESVDGGTRPLTPLLLLLPPKLGARAKISGSAPKQKRSYATTRRAMREQLYARALRLVVYVVRGSGLTSWSGGVCVSRSWVRRSV